MAEGTRKYDVAVVGEINADLILSGNVVPAFGQVEQVIDEANLVMGSSAVIFACGASRLGLRTVFIGKVGDDQFGKFMLQSMRSRGIDVSGVKIDPHLQTGFSVILSEGNDRAILTFPGSIPELNYEDIDLNLLGASKHLHLSSFFLLDRLRQFVPLLFQQAKEMGLSISLDTNYDPKEKWNGGLKKAFEWVDVFLPNETEAIAISKEKEVERAIYLLNRSIDCIAVKMGSDGALAKIKDSPVIRTKTIPVDVVDTVGAGDSFDAGFIYGYLNQWNLEDIIELAVACGSISTLSAGGTQGQATLDLATDFISRHKEEMRAKK